MRLIRSAGRAVPGQEGQRSGKRVRWFESSRAYWLTGGQDATARPNALLLLRRSLEQVQAEVGDVEVVGVFAAAKGSEQVAAGHLPDRPPLEPSSPWCGGRLPLPLFSRVSAISDIFA